MAGRRAEGRVSDRHLTAVAGGALRVLAGLPWSVKCPGASREHPPRTARPEHWGLEQGEVPCVT